MYYRRLKIFLALIALVLLAWAGRLVHLQILRGDDFRQQAKDSLIRPARFIPTERGRVVDRYNHLLARDVQTKGLAVDYRILAGDPKYLARQAGRNSARLSDAELEAVIAPVRRRYDELLAEAAAICNVPPEQLQQRRREIVEQVQAVKDSVSQRQGRPTTILEETICHTLIENIDAEMTNRLIARFGQLLQDEPGLERRAAGSGIVLARQTQRVYPWGECMAHLVGTEGAVTTGDLANDPFAEVEHRRYLPGERKGLTGVERSCEGLLRGARGLIQLDREDQPVEKIPPVRGADVKLTIDADLQQQVYRVLAHHVDNSPYPIGGAVVVINIGERTIRNGHRLRDGEVLAMVSYPSFDPNRWQQDYARLLGDTRGRPLLFRAVGGVYPPGSIVKPAVLAAALQQGVIAPDQPLECRGQLIPNYNAFHCWNEHGHGPLLPSDAVKYSCNVYFYKLGQNMGLPRLTDWLGRFGLGHDQHTGLIEERRGTLPTPLWLASHRRGRGYSVGDARNVAIGQGDLGVTPLAAANLVATIARDGVFLYPAITTTDAAESRAGIDLGIRRSYSRLARDGMDRVVNESGGTALNYAHMDNVRLAGKTGSAQASRRRIDGRLYPPTHDYVVRRTVDGGTLTRYEAIDPSHGWFAGYAPSDKPTVAIACLVEYGMSGGRSAGPLARDVIQLCVNLDYVPAPADAKRDVLFALPQPATAGEEAHP